MTSDVALSPSLKRGLRKPHNDFVDKEDITIVVPTLNEALGIGRVIEDILNEGYYKILVVDGYSVDDTLEVASTYDVKIIHQVGKGKTGAIKTSINHITTPFFAVIDGDTTYNPKDIQKFLPHVKFYNHIIGAREKGRNNISLLNRFGNWVINKFFNLMFGTQLSDVCSGLYTLNTKYARELIFKTQGFDVEVEIAAQSAYSGSITELPITYSERVGAQKLNPWKDGFRIMRTISRLARVYNSIILYSFISALTIIPALLLLTWVSIEAFNGIWHNGIALGGILLVILATQAFTISAIASQQRHIEQRLLRKIRDVVG